MTVKHWTKIKGYRRDYLLKAALTGKAWTIENFIKEGAKLGLKPVTMKLKLRRWLKADGTVKKGKNGEIKFA